MKKQSFFSHQQSAISNQLGILSRQLTADSRLPL